MTPETVVVVHEWPWVVPVVTAFIGLLSTGLTGLITLLTIKLNRHKAEIIVLKDENEINIKMADEAVDVAHAVTSHSLAAQGKPPIPTVAPVVSESASPSTALQRRVARMATQRARLTAIRLAAGIDARPEPEHGPNGPKKELP